MKSPILLQLLRETWQSPVYGDSFGANVHAKQEAVLQQIGDIWEGFTQEFDEYLANGMPELTAAQRHDLAMQIAPKTVGFCPALTVGELNDVPRLQAVAMAIALMYWGDQTMDRGDLAMPLAIEQLAGQQVTPPAKLTSLVQARLSALQGIAKKVQAFAAPEDQALVLDCYDQQVLALEVRLHRLSEQYQQVVDKPVFLAQHGEEIAHIMTVDAGFPSVASSLYAIYRQHDSILPPLTEVYAQPELVQLLRTSNAVVRVLDELGDWETDAGHHPEWGSFCLNLFNQAHPALLQPFLAGAGFSADQRQQLVAAFSNFHVSETTRQQNAEVIQAAMVQRAQDAVGGIAPEVQNKFELYILLCKRVMEIGYVNRVGDIALAQ